MIVCDSSPFISLASVGCLDLLPRLLGSIDVPQAVVAEVAIRGPIPVPPLHRLEWIRVHPDRSGAASPHIAMLNELHAGEKQVILLALEHGAQIVINERYGRLIAESLGLPVLGTLAVVLRAKQAGMVPSFRKLIEQMRACSARFSPALVDRLAKLVGE